MSMPLSVTSTQVNEERHHARIRGADLERIVAAAVAAQAGIDLDASSVRVDARWILHRDANSHTEVEADVLIVVNRQGEPPAGPGYL